MRGAFSALVRPDDGQDLTVDLPVPCGNPRIHFFAGQFCHSEAALQPGRCRVCMSGLRCRLCLDGFCLLQPDSNRDAAASVRQTPSGLSCRVRHSLCGSNGAE